MVNANKVRTPEYAMCYQIGADNFWFIEGEWFDTCRGTIHKAKTFASYDECEKIKLMIMNEEPVGDVDHSNLKIVDIANDILFTDEVKRLRWKRNVHALTELKYKWNWSQGIIDKYGVEDPDPISHYHIKIETQKGVVDFWPSTGKWRTDKDGTGTRHGLSILIEYLRTRGLKNE